MPTKRKLPAARKRKPKRRATPKTPNGHDLLSMGWVLPQGCSPAEKLAALEALAELHGVKPIKDIRELKGDFWPEDESVDEFLAARKRWQ